MAHRIFPRAGNLPIDAARSVNVGGRHQNSVMERELPPTLRYLIRRQSGVVSRVQALQAGLSEEGQDQGQRRRCGGESDAEVRLGPGQVGSVRDCGRGRQGAAPAWLERPAAHMLPGLRGETE
jgi:hypothetical protein